MPDETEYDKKWRQICERIIAVSATGGDIRPLQKQLQELLKEKEQNMGLRLLLVR